MQTPVGVSCADGCEINETIHIVSVGLLARLTGLEGLPVTTARENILFFSTREKSFFENVRRTGYQSNGSWGVSVSFLFFS